MPTILQRARIALASLSESSSLVPDKVNRHGPTIAHINEYRLSTEKLDHSRTDDSATITQCSSIVSMEGIMSFWRFKCRSPTILTHPYVMVALGAVCSVDSMAALLFLLLLVLLAVVCWTTICALLTRLTRIVMEQRVIFLELGGRSSWMRAFLEVPKETPNSQTAQVGEHWRESAPLKSCLVFSADDSGIAFDECAEDMSTSPQEVYTSLDNVTTYVESLYRGKRKCDVILEHLEFVKNQIGTLQECDDGSDSAENSGAPTKDHRKATWTNSTLADTDNFHDLVSQSSCEFTCDSLISSARTSLCGTPLYQTNVYSVSQDSSSCTNISQSSADIRRNFPTVKSHARPVWKKVDDADARIGVIDNMNHDVHVLPAMGSTEYGCDGSDKPAVLTAMDGLLRHKHNQSRESVDSFLESVSEWCGSTPLSSSPSSPLSLSPRDVKNGQMEILERMPVESLFPETNDTPAAFSTNINTITLPKATPAATILRAFDIDHFPSLVTNSCHDEQQIDLQCEDTSSSLSLSQSANSKSEKKQVQIQDHHDRTPSKISEMILASEREQRYQRRIVEDIESSIGIKQAKIDSTLTWMSQHLQTKNLTSIRYRFEISRQEAVVRYQCNLLQKHRHRCVQLEKQIQELRRTFINLSKQIHEETSVFTSKGAERPRSRQISSTSTADPRQQIGLFML